MQKKIIQVLFLIALPMIGTTSLVKAQPESEIAVSKESEERKEEGENEEGTEAAADTAILGDINWVAAAKPEYPIQVKQTSEVNYHLQSEFAEALAITANEIGEGKYKIKKKIKRLSSTVELVGETLQGFSIVILLDINTKLDRISVRGRVHKTVLTDAYAALGIDGNKRGHKNSQKDFNAALEKAIRDIINGAEAMLLSSDQDSEASQE